VHYFRHASNVNNAKVTLSQFQKGVKFWHSKAPEGNESSGAGGHYEGNHSKTPQCKHNIIMISKGVKLGKKKTPWGSAFPQRVVEKKLWENLG
jgi:hypothetical protein